MGNERGKGRVHHHGHAGSPGQGHHGPHGHHGEEEGRGETLSLTSVGIDIGSSTSHLIFSRLIVGKPRGPLPGRHEVLERRILYRSPILLTPYTDPLTVDGKQLERFILDTYGEAGLSPEEIDTGAVIITGEAARKRNAETIIQLFAGEVGRFVCATAGPNLEAVLAAHGSGAVELSRSEDCSILNVDIGGGTTKVAQVRQGQVVGTAVINVGSRLVGMDEAGRLVRVEEAGRQAGTAIGLELRPGARLTRPEQEQLADTLVTALIEYLKGGVLSPLVAKLVITPPLSLPSGVDLILFSGGVSEYLYGYEQHEYGDLGRLLGEGVRSRLSQLPWSATLVEPTERIRATVIGACQYTLQLSGDTIYLSTEAGLPLHNVPVVAVPIAWQGLNAAAVASSIKAGLTRVDLAAGEALVAIALRTPPLRGYSRVEELVQGIAQALESPVGNGLPLILVFNQNMAQVVGQRLADLVGGCYSLICIDEVDLHALDYIDIGRRQPDQNFVPVVVKSLVF